MRIWRFFVVRSVGFAVLCPVLVLLAGLSAAQNLTSGIANSAGEARLAPGSTAASSASHQDAMERHIREREYWASRNVLGLQAPNRQHDLRTYFGPDGIRVEGRTTPGSSDLLSLELAGFGRTGALAEPGAGKTTSNRGRVEIHRPGMVEWYENAARGLEQGFTLVTRPGGKGAVVLELRVVGASASLEREEVIFLTKAGRRLRYASFEAWDASGRSLPAHMTVPAENRVRLAVEDSGAVYPIVLDPLLTAVADAVIESDDQIATLGDSVSGAGDVNGDGFADVIVGARGYDVGQLNEGAAFVFLGNSSGIAGSNPVTAHAEIQANLPNAFFGWGVSGGGDVNGDGFSDIIVSSPFYTNGQGAEGAAFVFHGSPGGITATTLLDADSVIESDQAGANLLAVSDAGDVNGDGYDDVILGSRLYEVAPPGGGAAFVFFGSAAGVIGGSPAAGHTLHPQQAGADFGRSVAGAGDVNADGFDDVIVGASSYTNGQSSEGAAFVFLGSATGPTGSTPGDAHAILESDRVSANMGWSVAGAGDVNGDGFLDVIVGAPAYAASASTPAASAEGAAFVFLGSISGIVGTNPMNAHALVQGDDAESLLGSSVDGAGDVDGDGYADLIIGASRYHDSVGERMGAAFVFFGSTSGIADTDPSSANASLDTNQAASSFGASVATAGDVNGDGFADIIVGAPYYDGGETSEGAAFLFLGGSEGVRDGGHLTAHAVITSNSASSGFGFSSAAGDINGDGYSDVIAGRPAYDTGNPNGALGAVFVFLGSAAGIMSGLDSGADTVLLGDDPNLFFGFSVASAGDLNGDGYGDLIAGARYVDVASTPCEPSSLIPCGTAYIFLGSESGIANNSAATADTLVTGPAVGGSVAGAGDTNGDGFSDVLVTSSWDTCIFHGGPQGIPNGDIGMAQGCASGLALGRAAGDVNGDGFGDVVFGLGYTMMVLDGIGEVRVVPGSLDGLDFASIIGLVQGQSLLAPEKDYFGLDVSGAGDINADGFSDIIIGSHDHDHGPLVTERGAAFVFLGSGTGIMGGSLSSWADAHAMLKSEELPAFFTQGGNQAGRGVGPAGDVDADGYDDVIVAGMNGYWAVVFHGNAAGLSDATVSEAQTKLPETFLSSAGPLEHSFQPGGVGDVNGDGYADIALGNLENTGYLTVHLGSGDGDGRPANPRVTRPGGTVPVQPWGHSWDEDGFEVSLSAHHPAARGRVRLQIEACPPGVPTGDAACSTHTGANWTDIIPSQTSVTLSERVGGLVSGTLYRWRARILFADVSKPGITDPPVGTRGPWRRLFGQNDGSVVRIGVPDSDLDGVEAVVEQAGPNAGDANGDGVQDAEQPAVASLPDLGGSDYVSIDATNACPFVTNVSVSAESSGAEADPDNDYPFGLVGFTLPCSGPAVVKLYFHGTENLAPPYRKYGPTTPGDAGTLAWYTLPGAVFGSEEIGGATVATVEILLEDGVLGDATGVDFKIVDPGGPVPEPGFGLSLLSGLALLRWLTLRRRKYHA